MSDVTVVNLTRSYVERETPDTFTPLGALYVTSALEKQGCDVDFRDYLTRGDHRFPDPAAPRSILSFLRDSADVLGISCVGSLLPNVLLALKELKEECPGKTIVLGGIGASGAPADLLKEFPFIDVIVTGEGEETAAALMDCLTRGKNLTGVRGISYSRQGVIHCNPQRQRIVELDKIPFPAYHKINFSDYSVISLITSRGCPYGCSFCDAAPFWGRRNYKRSIDNVIEEIQLLVEEYGQRRIELVDDTFTLDKKRVMQFCKRLREKQIDIAWSCFSRVDTIDKDMMAAMADNGCVLIFYGIESGSPRILQRIGKRITREQAWQTISESAYYFDVMASLMWGFPFETLADFRETTDFFKRVAEITSTIYLFSLNPFPLSRLYQEYGHDIVFDEAWGRKMGGIDKKEILEMVKKYPRVFPGFYHYRHEHFQEKYAILEKEGLINTFMSCSELCSDA